MTNKKFLAFLTLSLLAALIISGVSFTLRRSPSVEPQPDQDQDQNRDQEIASQGDIKKFKDNEELKKFLQENKTVSSREFSGRGMPMEESSGSFDSVQSMQKQAAPASGSSQDHSETNIQVEGVDEADIVKTDGEYIYAVSGADLFIIRSYPAEEAEIISRIEFENSPQNIYLNEDKLVVFGRNSRIYEKEGFSDMPRRGSFSFFKVFDISDKENPEQVRDMDFEGNYFDSRMIDDYVYFITSNPRYHYLEDAPALPRILENEEVITDDKCQGDKCLNPEVYYFDIPYDNYNFTNVAAINVQDDQEKINSEMYLFSGNQEMYVSPNNIYITYTKRMNPQRVIMEVTLDVFKPILSQEEQEKISKIQEVEDYILSEDEKWRKIGEVVEKHLAGLSTEERENMEKDMEKEIKKKWEEIRKKLEKTVIHKIAIDENELEYQTKGEVTGYVLNQFSMSEQGDYFRIATTKNRDWGGMAMSSSEDRESYSNIYVLDQDLDVVGGVEELAPGERIYSARFMQDRAYLVTFKQIDPLFVVDLEDPRNPEVLGELKIPGFSNYLHPYDDETLIGIGKETEVKNGRVRQLGLKLSLFDVSNVSDPEQIDTHIMGDSGSDSPALNDHKAFLFDRERNLLALPVELRSNSADTSDPEARSETQGEMIIAPGPIPRYNRSYEAAIFHVDKEGFELRDSIKHSDGEDHSDRIKRVLYIDDTLYTFSDNYLKMNDLEDLEELRELELITEDHQVFN